MYLGHVDHITRRVVAGWAADSENLDSPVELAVIVNGAKVAHVVCDRLREDLLSRGTYGNGQHGFQHQFTPPLPDNIDLTIAVRFADSGQPVWNGDAVLVGGAAEARVVSAPPQMPILPAPTSPPALFRLLGLLDPRQGLYPLLYRLDFAGIRRAQIEYSVFGEVDSPLPNVGAWDQQIARDYLNDLLHSDRFRREILGHVFRAFPEKQRLFFIHIPKCAGSDLASHLGLLYPSVKQQWQEEAWFGREDLFLALAEFVRELQFSDSILTAGHVRLDTFIDAGLVRPIDRVFTIVRDPIDIAISSINYVLTRIQSNVRTKKIETDVRDWLSTLGISELPYQITPQFTADLIRRALYNPVVVQPDSICYWLGGGNANAVIERLARNHVELTTTARYDSWLRSSWGVATRTMTNVSTKYLTLSSLSHQDLAYLKGLSPEDRKLYDLIEERLAASGRTSITGEDLL